MTLSDLSVRRPVFAGVAAIILAVVGIASFFSLSVRELPNVDPPQVSVLTTYTGASAEIVEERITQLIERQISGIQGLDRVSSTSRDGRSVINISFLAGRDLEIAANDVRDAVSKTLNRLPMDADPPQVSKANADAQPVLLVGLYSDTRNRMELTDFANRYLIERLSTIPGVATVGMAGGQNFAMRVWLNPAAMAARNVTVEDITNALNHQNIELPAGSLESTSKDFTVRVARNYVSPEDFAQLPIVMPAAPSGASALTSTSGAGGTLTGTTGGARAGSSYLTRLGDVARIEKAPDENRRMFRVSKQDMLGFAIIRQSDSNELDISNQTLKAVAEINKTLPKDLHVMVGADFSVFTREAIKEVWITMGASLALVALVNLLFLGSWRSAIIPTIVAPICILSTFIALAVFGLTINLLTLLALVLSIGLVVDDAIVVVENIQRRIDEGEPPVVAAERGARQVFFAIIAVTAVLLSVFAPMMFMPGYAGKLFVELAIAVAAAVAFSALLALTLSPMLSSRLLRPAASEGWLARGVNRVVNATRRSYTHSLDTLLGKRAAGIVATVILLALAGVAVGLFITLPKELVPSEDRGRINMGITGPEGAGYDYITKITLQTEPTLEKLRQEGILERYMLTIGQGPYNTAGATILMVPWAKRKVTTDQITTRINRELSTISGARIGAAVQAPIGGGGNGGAGNNLQMIAKGDDYAALNAWLQPILQAARDNPRMQRVRLDYEPTAPRLMIAIDQQKAAALGVAPRAIGNALATMFGSSKVTTYIEGGEEYDVILQAQREDRETIANIDNIYVRSVQGSMVPLSNLVHTEVTGDTPSRPRIDRQRAITLTAELADGYTMSDAIGFLKKEVAKQPPSAVIAWGGAAKDFIDGQNGIGAAFGMALLLVFLVLAAQFESWIHPIIIITTVPLATVGGLFALLMTGSTLNLYSQIGLIILIGISAKNGILIVEFANQMRDEGLTVKQAIIKSASVRLRPIVMTSIAASMGALPLIVSSGPGAASRFTIGTVIFAGCLFSTLLTLFMVPIFYNMLARFTKSPEWNSKQIEAYDREEKKQLELARMSPSPLPAE